MSPRQRLARRQAGLLMAPALVVLGVVTAYPVLWVFWLSVQERVPIFDIARPAGLGHYRFLAGDARFLGAFGTTLLFTLASVALETVLGLLVALALAGQRRGRRVAFALLLLAWAMPAVVTARMFEWLYHPAAGVVNVLLGGARMNWLGDPGLALPAVVAADVWRTLPFVAVLAYARRIGIPSELYEAAQVDGAGALARFARITLPLLRPVLVVAALFRTLDALRAFDLMFVLTGGGPANATETLTIYAYRALFQMVQFGFGAAIGVVVFCLVMVVAWLYVRHLRPEAAT